MPVKSLPGEKLLIVKDLNTGETMELGRLTDIETVTSQDYIEEYCPLTDPWHTITGTFELSTDLITMQPKTKLRLLYGLTNNALRLHGGRALRTIKKRYLTS